LIAVGSTGDLTPYRAATRAADYNEGGEEMQGRITRISVTYELDDVEGGAKYRFIGTPALERYMRPERFEELMEDLTGQMLRHKISEDFAQWQAQARRLA
jgi:hypothetical protein